MVPLVGVIKVNFVGQASSQVFSIMMLVLQTRYLSHGDENPRDFSK